MSRDGFGVYKHLYLNILIALIVVGLYMLSVSYGTVGVMGRAYAVPIYRGNAEGRIALQCVVDWNASSLGDILDELREREVTITFLVSGEWAGENAETLEVMAEDGHEIGVLGMRSDEDGGFSWVRSDIEAASAAVISATGNVPTLYHPGGRRLDTSVRAADSLDMDAVMCTADLLCARGGSKEIIKRALENAAEGSIIIVQPTAAFAEALPQLIQLYERKGLTPVSTTAVLGRFR